MSARRYRAVISVVSSVTLLIGAAPALGQTRPRATATSGDLNSALEATARLVAPTVVEIFATAYLPGDPLVSRSSDLVTTQRASGSGVIVDADGYIVTNAHVVRGAQRLRVDVAVPATGRSILATSSRAVTGHIVGMDVETDIAVIKIDAHDLPALAFGDSDTLNAGQLVLAFGSPLGLHNSVSLGVVSAVARQLEPESPMIYVQTDASINPGSSGGPLVDLAGRLIGINTLIASRGGGHEGVGFAAPSNIVRTVYQQIRKVGHVRRGDIGVRVQSVSPVLAAGLRLKTDRGVILADVAPAGPSARAGLRPGDVVLSLDGKPMENGRQLQVNLYRRYVGDVVSLEVVRGEQILNLAVAITERNDPFSGGWIAQDPREHLVARLGILGVTLDRRVADLLPVVRVATGVVVAAIVAGAIDSREGGLAPGDIIYAVNGTPVGDLTRLRLLLDQLQTGDPVVLQLERRGGLLYVAFTIE